ncbi:shikimate dehydrogenase family protein [Actinomadura macrotermitis]|uniref:Shikimate dehydrogenase (NADP(+)) n=1 Tax=Actinomadura macrotermitis TaxID=2585200 RepID=A0A7K0C0E9_9ACTN|nr:Shikimate dehydrogenase (NADP(+)) [Actinomadura macrotermitis]
MSGGGPAAIGGATRLYAVLGDPVAQVRAPALLNPLFAGLGLDAVLVPVHVGAADLAAVLAGLAAVRNLDGLLVTVPHKIAVCGLAGALGPAAAVSGSANALRRRPGGGWYAEDFDGAGFVAGLEAAGHRVRGARFAIAGAGGAGGAIAAAVLTAGAAEVRLHDTDPARPAGIAARLARHWPGRIGPVRAVGERKPDVAVNATPLGLRPDDPLPFDPAGLPAGCVVADIVMRPRDTALLRAAAGLGHPVHHGAHMLDHQVALYRDFFGLEGPAPP